MEWKKRGDIKDLPLQPGDLVLIETLLDGFHGGKVSQVTVSWKGDVYEGAVWLENNTAILWKSVAMYYIVPPR